MNLEKVAKLSEKAISEIPAGLAPDKWIEVYNQKIVELTVKESVAFFRNMDYQFEAEQLEEYWNE